MRTLGRSAAALALVLLTACGLPQPRAQATVGPTPGAAAPAATPSAGAVAPIADQRLIGRIAARAKPGIVQITNERMSLQASGRQIVPAGVGTGFVIDGQGHILTNNHVVEQAQKLEVQTTDGKTFPARLVGRDPRTDLAVIRVEGQSLPTLPLGG